MLLRCAAEVVRAGEGADLVFVGRSLENLYDLLCGALDETSWRGRAQLLQLSLRGVRSPGQLRREAPGALEQLWCYFRELRLTPPQLLLRERPVAFVDLVCSGRTLGALLRLLHAWCGGRPGRWRQVRERVRFVAVVEVGHPRWTPWRAEHSEWPGSLAPDHVRRVWLQSEHWRFLGEDQDKTTESFTYRRWSDPRARAAPPDGERHAAARLGRALFRRGAWERAALGRRIARSPCPPELEPLARELCSA
ncbi:MAG: hypothetical protein AB7N76_33910 [Planctomycetota bacterium]